MQTFLAVDLGTATGWALRTGEGAIVSGTWRLLPKPKGAHPGLRYANLFHVLEKTVPEGPLVVHYEDVKRHLGTQAAHVYGGLLAMLQYWCFARSCECHGVGVGQIKKFWTGNGSATKGHMIAEARARGFEPDDDNEADAIALLHYACLR